MQIQSEDLAKSLGIETGQFVIKQSENSQPRPKRRYKVPHSGKQSVVIPENCSTNADETENWVTGSSVIQTSSFDEFIDTQKLLEFALSSANAKDIDDLEASQVMHSDYLEGPVIKIQEFPGNMPEISGGTSTTSEDDMLFCYMTHPSQSTDDLAATSDSSEPNLSFRQSLMVTSAPVTQSSALSFPLTLTVDGSALDSCQSMQLS